MTKVIHQQSVARGVLEASCSFSVDKLRTHNLRTQSVDTIDLRTDQKVSYFERQLFLNFYHLHFLCIRFSFTHSVAPSHPVPFWYFLRLFGSGFYTNTCKHWTKIVSIRLFFSNLSFAIHQFRALVPTHFRLLFCLLTTNLLVFLLFYSHVLLCLERLVTCPVLPGVFLLTLTHPLTQLPPTDCFLNATVS